MAKNRYNTVPDFTPKSERQSKEEPSIPRTPCIICGTVAPSYGVWESGNTCCKTCEAIQEAKPKFLGEEYDEPD